MVEFDPLLVDAQNTDMANMVMPAGIDAAGNLDLQIADLVGQLSILETLRDFLRQRDRARIGQRAVIKPRADDHVGDLAGIGRAQIDLVEF